MNHQRKMTNACVALLWKHPFFGLLKQRLDVKVDTACETFWTDGKNFGYNPHWLNTQTQGQVEGAICAALMRISSGHAWRRGKRDYVDWQRAGNLAVHPLLKENELELPGGAELIPEFAGKTVEQIYDLIHQPPEPVPQPEPEPSAGAGESDDESEGEESDDAQSDADSDGDDDGESDGSDGAGDGDGGQQGQSSSDEDGDEQEGKGQGQSSSGQQGQGKRKPNFGGGEVRDAEVESEAEVAQAEGEWKMAMANAASFARKQGTLPAGFERWFEEVMQPRIDWRAATWRWIQEQTQSNYNWNRPNPRLMQTGFFMPKLHTTDMGELVVGIDTSGSILEEVFGEMGAELTAIAAQCRPKKVIVLYCDAAVHRVEEFEPGDDIVLNPIGGGGTDFRPVFNWIAENDIQPAGLIFMTDLMGTFPRDEPDYPVLWGVTEPYFNPPFGESVRLHD
jgi:predicted metal-dependent peptidase